jgi:hypothetical protein
MIVVSAPFQSQQNSRGERVRGDIFNKSVFNTVVSSLFLYVDNLSENNFFTCRKGNGCIPLLQRYLAIGNGSYTNKACVGRLNKVPVGGLVCIAPDFQSVGNLPNWDAPRAILS